MVSFEKVDSTDGQFNTFYPMTDHLGSVALLAESPAATGGIAIAEYYTYSSFGKPTAFNSNREKINNFTSRHLFTGREYIPQIDLYDYRNRFYSADLGRFLQTDPIGFGDKYSIENYNKYQSINEKFLFLDKKIAKKGVDINNLYRYVSNETTKYTDYNGNAYIPEEDRTLDDDRGGLLWPNSIIDKAWEQANEDGGGSDGGDRRHCIAACMLRKNYGAVGGLLRDLWDGLVENPEDETFFGEDSRADMRAEDFGEKCAKKGNSESCRCCCADYEGR